MRRLLWVVVVALTVSLVVGVLWLDRRQARRGAPSVFSQLWGLPWRAGAARTGTARVAAPAGRKGSGSRRVAIIVDELGARADVVERLLALRRPLTLAIQPGLPLSGQIARDAVRAGMEVLVQLPLEPYRFPEEDPGPGVLTLAMTPEEVTRRTRTHMAGLPGAVGVATRMGSRFTEDGPRMRALLEPVFLQGLFFVDSVTTSRSVGYDLARALGIAAARRQVFLDPEGSEAVARARFADAERWAARRGSVVAIGPGRLLTVQLLEETLPRWESQGLRLVPVSELLVRDAAPARAAG